MMLLMLLVTLIFFVNAVNGDADVDHDGNFFPSIFGLKMALLLFKGGPHTCP